VKRRQFISFLGGAAAAPIAWPRPTRAQPPVRLRRIGVLLYTPQDRVIIKPFLDEFQRIGYVDGKNVTVEYRDANGNYERLPEAAAELARLSPDVIFSFGGEQAPIVKQATATIPIVVVVSNDPVATGLVASLARPGGNITGITWVHEQLAGKTIELLKDAAPWVSRVAILWNPDHTDPEFRETQRAARTLGMQLQSLEVRKPGDFDGAFQAATRERAEALIALGSRLISVHQRLIGDFAAKNRLILVGAPRWVSEIGGLLSYGANVAELTRKAAGYVDKILKGAKPSDLPMQQPTTFELVINLKAAKALGLVVPPTLLARADDVIE
jgi:putative tryptophan/tyrosine transport system substrate-binding protein